MVLPLLALTWMSAVLAITDRRSALFQILFAIFDSLEGFVIVMVHCILRREVAHVGMHVTRKSRGLLPKLLGHLKSKTFRPSAWTQRFFGSSTHVLALAWGLHSAVSSAHCF